MRNPQVDGVIAVMIECAQKLPEQWEDDFWRESAQDLARILIEHRTTLPALDQGALVGIGGMMLRQFQKEGEALSLTEQVFGRAREKRND